MLQIKKKMIKKILKNVFQMNRAVSAEKSRSLTIGVVKVTTCRCDLGHTTTTWN